MVSGFFTSPYDQERIMSGDASPILIESKFSTGTCCLNNLSKSFITLSLALEFDVDGQGTYFLDQDIERLRHAGFHFVVAIDDRLVHLGTSVDVVGLDREHLLQGVRGPIGLQRPHFHLTEALTAELRLAAQRLLSDQAVWSGGAGMHLV